MKYSFNTYQKILRILADQQRKKPWNIASGAEIARPTANTYLKKMLEEWKIRKKGASPHIYYQIADAAYIPSNSQDNVYHEHDFAYAETEIFDTQFLKYDADGSILQGTQWFITRCKYRNLDIYTAWNNFIHIYESIKKLQNKCGLLDASHEFAKHVDVMWLDHLYYTWQYKRNEFGRSKLAEQWFYAKQMQDKKLLDEVCLQIVSKISCLVKNSSIDALAFTPPSIKRRVQILDVLDSHLQHISLPRVQLLKDYPNNIITPQKSLRKRSDRLRNARNTIYVYDASVSTYKHVLLIDDFVWSWSTLNETAKKLKAEWVQIVSGCAIVGNMDLSYEVINEM